MANANWDDLLATAHKHATAGERVSEHTLTPVLIFSRLCLRLAYRAITALEGSCRLFGRSTLRYPYPKHDDTIVSKHSKLSWVQRRISPTGVHKQVLLGRFAATEYCCPSDNGRKHEGFRSKQRESITT